MKEVRERNGGRFSDFFDFDFESIEDQIAREESKADVNRHLDTLSIAESLFEGTLVDF